LIAEKNPKDGPDEAAEPFGGRGRKRGREGASETGGVRRGESDAEENRGGGQEEARRPGRAAARSRRSSAGAPAARKGERGTGEKNYFRPS